MIEKLTDIDQFIVQVCGGMREVIRQRMSPYRVGQGNAARRRVRELMRAYPSTKGITPQLMRFVKEAY